MSTYPNCIPMPPPPPDPGVTPLPIGPRAVLPKNSLTEHLADKADPHETRKLVPAMRKGSGAPSVLSTDKETDIYLDTSANALYVAVKTDGTLSWRPTSATATTIPWSGVTGTPTSLSGYGITDAAPSSHLTDGSAHSSLFASKITNPSYTSGEKYLKRSGDAVSWADVSQGPSEYLKSVSKDGKTVTITDQSGSETSFTDTGDENVIETVKVNGGALTPVNKAVDVTVPTALSALSEDSTHRLVTDAEKTTWSSKQDAIAATGILKGTGSSVTAATADSDYAKTRVFDGNDAVHANGDVYGSAYSSWTITMASGFQVSPGPAEPFLKNGVWVLADNGSTVQHYDSAISAWTDIADCSRFQAEGSESSTALEFKYVDAATPYKVADASRTETSVKIGTMALVPVAGIASGSVVGMGTDGKLAAADMSGYVTSGQIANMQTTDNLKTGLSDGSDTYYPSQKAVKTAVDAKQDQLHYNVADWQTGDDCTFSAAPSFSDGVWSVKLDRYHGQLQTYQSYDYGYMASASGQESTANTFSATGTILKADASTESVTVVFSRNVATNPSTDLAQTVTSASTDAQIPTAKAVYAVVSGKATKKVPSATYNIATLDANGDLADSEKSFGSFISTTNPSDDVIPTELGVVSAFVSKSGDTMTGSLQIGSANYPTTSLTLVGNSSSGFHFQSHTATGTDRVTISPGDSYQNPSIGLLVAGQAAQTTITGTGITKSGSTVSYPAASGTMAITASANGVSAAVPADSNGNLNLSTLFSSTDTSTDPQPTGVLNNSALDKGIVKVIAARCTSLDPETSSIADIINALKGN